LVIVSATTPAETFLAWVTTATCLPQGDDGQYHLMWSPLPCFHVQPLARSARSTSLPGRDAERFPSLFGMGPAVVLGQDLTEGCRAGKATVRRQISQRVTGSRVTVTAKRREGDLLTTTMMPAGVILP
jgi:hypothetical protein